MNTLLYFSAKFNHSCYPNAEIFLNEDARHVVAIDNIEEGEEIVHNYLNNVYEANQRRDEIMERWNFYCNCHCCDTEEDLMIMFHLSKMENEINKKTISIEQMKKTLSILLDLRFIVRKIRIDKTLYILDQAYEYVCIFGSINQHMSMAKEITILGRHLSNILHNENDSRYQKWCHRENYNYLYFFGRKIISIIKVTFSVLTYTIILMNFFQVNVTPFIMLTLTFVMSQKI